MRGSTIGAMLAALLFASSAARADVDAGDDGGAGDAGVGDGSAPLGDAGNGASCDAGAQCATGFCADGVCCTASCSGQCEVCDDPTSFGTCVPVIGTPRGDRPLCPQATPTNACAAASCDGVTTTSCAHFPGIDVVCAGAQCSDGGQTLSAYCNGQGTCLVREPTPCGAYACGTTACNTTCSESSDCVPGAICDVASGTCLDIGTYCDGNHTIHNLGLSTTTDCTPYECANGACLTECVTDGDCATPNVCDDASHCVSKAQAASETSGNSPSGSSGGCALGTARGRGGAGLFALAAIAALRLARRRRR